MDKFDLKKYITESKLLKENSGVEGVIEILQKYVIDKLGADEPYIAEDNIPQIAEEIALLFKKELDGGKLNEDLFGKYATRKAPRDTTDKNNPDYALYMGNDDPEYRRFYMALKRLIEKSSKNLDQNFEILDWIESLLNNIRPGK
jgi:hypothetical protein